MFFFTDTHRLNALWKEKVKVVEATEEQLRAGIRELDRFGVQGLLYSLSNGNILNADLVLLKPYYEIMGWVMYETEVASYNRRLAEVMKKKK